MRDVFVVVIRLDVIDRDAGVLINQTAILTSHEPERTGFSGQVILRENEFTVPRAATAVAVHYFRN